MAKQISKTAIGGFVIIAMVLLVAAVVVLGGGEFFKREQQFVMFFEGSVKGLSVGAPVVFRGVEIGTVENVVMSANVDTLAIKIPVIISIDRDQIQVEGSGDPDPERDMRRLIEMGLKAQLTIQSFVTGQMMIQFDFHPDKEIRLVGTDLPYTEIPTIPSAVQEITKTLQEANLEDTFKRLNSAISGIETLVTAPEVMDTVRALKATVVDADRLVKNTDKLVKNVDSRVDPVATSIEQTVTDVGKLARNVDAKVAPLATSVGDSLEAARAALRQAETTLASIDHAVAEDSILHARLVTALEEISLAARSISVLAETMEHNPDAVIRGKLEVGGK